MWTQVKEGRSHRPTWRVREVPRLGARRGQSRRCPRIALKTMSVHGFDHRARWVARVRNVSRPGRLIRTLRAALAQTVSHGSGSVFKISRQFRRRRARTRQATNNDGLPHG